MQHWKETLRQLEVGERILFRQLMNCIQKTDVAAVASFWSLLMSVLVTCVSPGCRHSSFSSSCSSLHRLRSHHSCSRIWCLPVFPAHPTITAYPGRHSFFLNDLKWPWGDLQFLVLGSAGLQAGCRWEGSGNISCSCSYFALSLIKTSREILWNGTKPLVRRTNCHHLWICVLLWSLHLFLLVVKCAVAFRTAAFRPVSVRVAHGVSRNWWRTCGLWQDSTSASALVNSTEIVCQVDANAEMEKSWSHMGKVQRLTSTERHYIGGEKADKTNNLVLLLESWQHGP